MPSLGLRTQNNAGASRMRVPSGGGGGGVWNVLAGAAHSRVLNCGSPPRPKEEVLKVFEPKQVDIILNHGIQGTATWIQLSFVPYCSTGRGMYVCMHQQERGYNCPLCRTVAQGEESMCVCISRNERNKQHCEPHYFLFSVFDALKQNILQT